MAYLIVTALDELLALLCVLALLVSDAAACLASRLARGLAFAASAVLCAVAEITSFESLDMLHFSILRKIKLFGSRESQNWIYTLLYHIYISKSICFFAKISIIGKAFFIFSRSHAPMVGKSPIEGSQT